MRGPAGASPQKLKHMLTGFLVSEMGQAGLRLESQDNRLTLRFQSEDHRAAFVAALEAITSENGVSYFKGDGAGGTELVSPAHSTMSPAEHPVDHSELPAFKLEHLHDHDNDMASPTRVSVDTSEARLKITLPTQPTPSPLDLRQWTRTRLLNEIDSMLGSVAGGTECVLVFDRASHASVEAVLAERELVAAGCARIERLEKKHGHAAGESAAHQRPVHAMYVISPGYCHRDVRVLDGSPYSTAAGALASCCTNEQWRRVCDETFEGRAATDSDPPATLTSLDRLLRDHQRFRNGKLCYTSASVCFTAAPLASGVATLRKASSQLLMWMWPRVTLLGGEFFALESNVFSLGLPRVLVPLTVAHPDVSTLITLPETVIGGIVSHGGKRPRTLPTDRATTLEVIAAKLVSLCVTLGSLTPTIRFSVEGSPLPGMLAARLADDVGKAGAWGHVGEVHSPDVTVVIVDRTFDLPTVLLHDLTYQVCVACLCAGFWSLSMFDASVGLCS